MADESENFLVNREDREDFDTENIYTEYTESIAVLEYEDTHRGEKLDIPVELGKELRIGRVGDHDHKLDYIIPDDRVSKQHFRIYSVVYDNELKKEFPPLVYCEDLESTNGTYVNDECIGIIGRERIGHLLSDGDIVEIKPFWRFRFQQPIFQTISRTQTQLGDLQYFQDRYTVSDRMLGKGQYGEVYLGKELLTARQTACKIVNVDAAVQELTTYDASEESSQTWEDSYLRVLDGKKKIMREIRILSKLDHPHIVNLRKAFCSDNILYIFTDLAPGGDLFSYIDSHGGKLDDCQSRAISRQILLAIQYMHSQGIVHRDIKPENVLVMNTNFGGRVVLTDFGFAISTKQKMGRMLSKVGTNGYIAPEVELVDEKGGYTSAVDMWSFGILTACLLTGQPLFPRGQVTPVSQVEVAARILGTDDSQVKEKWQQLSPRAEKFLRRLLVVKPEDRLTADQALNHSWYTKPLTEAALLEQGYQRIIRFWRKRQSDDAVIENLPKKTFIPQTSQFDQPAPKLRRGKLPDTTMSPYFGLDRHLNPFQKASSKRKAMIDDLKESGLHFVNSKEHHKIKTVANTAARLGGPVRVMSVEARDLFLTSDEIVDAAQHDSYEISLVPTRLATPHSENFQLNLSDPAPSETLSTIAAGLNLAANVTEGHTNKRTRIPSENPEERRIRDAVAKELPKYCSAKVFRDNVVKKKEELEAMRQKTERFAIRTSSLPAV